MFSPSDYELLDFGNGEKLERFGGQFLVRRPAPVCYMLTPHHPELWDGAIEFDKDSGWNASSQAVDCKIDHRGAKFQISSTPTGQVGIFPEQAMNWDWILDSPLEIEGLKAINLFGYTGGTTLALAMRGAHVTHIDAAQPVVKWARENAMTSGLGEAPIRWIAEDAMRFIKREIKRGNRYDIVVADPPTFGRGPKKETWKIQRDLPDLIESLHELCGGETKMGILSCHTPEFETDDLAHWVRSKMQLEPTMGEEVEMEIQTQSGRGLSSGCCFRFAK